MAVNSNPAAAGKGISRTESNGEAQRTSPRKASKKRKESPEERKGRPVSELLELAVELAAKGHRGQTDKYDQPYILHVLSVMGRCRTIEEKIVALLHDLVEDDHITFAALRRRKFPERILEAVDLLTRRKGESYEAFVERIAPDPLARAVKLADLEDNMDIRRSNRAMKEKDAERMEKYRRAWQKLATIHSGYSPQKPTPPTR